MTARGDTIQVGLFGLDRAGEDFLALLNHLSEDEKQRASRFHFDRDRTRYVCARGLLRRFLGKELGLPAERIRFRYGPSGKPTLALDHAGSGIQFNVSHSDGQGLFVLTRGRAVGADLERIRPLRHGRALAERFFADDECAALTPLTGEAWDRAFFRCWTRKEAFIKALGDGLSYPLRAFSVSVSASEPARLIRVDGEAGPCERYWLTAIPAGEGFEAAIALEGPPSAIEALT
jgi:4'-phosphopantetheinyl transferase